MDTQSNKITLVLREKNDAQINAHYLNKNGIDAKPFPITNLNYITDTDTEILKKKFNYAIITSPKAIQVLVDIVSDTNNTLLKTSLVFSIGLETKKRLNEAGFINVLSALNNSKSLYDLILNSTNEEDYGLWVAAIDRKVDLQNMLKLNHRYIEILESYKTDPVRTLSQSVISFLEQYNQLDLIVFSSRNISIATDLLKNYKLFEKVNKKSTFFVNSKNVGLTAKKIGWSRIEVIKKNFTNDILNHIINLSKHMGN